jgi:hypothetical protein
MNGSSHVQGRRSLYRSFAASWGHTVASAALSSALACGVAAAIVFTGHPAEAEVTYDSAYGFERTWNSALRLVRVDMGCKITEKDDQSGYLMFEYHPADGGKKVSTGTMQFIRSHDKNGPVRLVIQLPQMPRYHEQVLLDALIRKMRAEYGEPPQPKPADPPAPPPASDAGASPAADAGNSF